MIGRDLERDPLRAGQIIRCQDDLAAHRDVHRVDVDPRRTERARQARTLGFMLDLNLATAPLTDPAEITTLAARMLRVPPAPALRDALVAFLDGELGTDRIDRAETYMEDALRMAVHLLMSTPEYQIV